MISLRGRRAGADELEALSRELERALPRSSEGAQVLVGVEHEYRVVRASTGESVDFRDEIHGLRLGRQHLDPDDPFAYRLGSGNVVTCDGREAEIVLAPLDVTAGTSSRLAATALIEQSRLAQRLPAALALEGHSTHVSVSAPSELVEAVGRAFSRHFAAALIRLVDSPDRCGVWVRPRPERLELCIDFVGGDRLAEVIDFVVGATVACISHVEGGKPALPPPLLTAATPPSERSGWDLGRRSFGGDPFAGPNEPLLLIGGGTMPAAEHLRAARAAIEANGSTADTATGREPAMSLDRAFGWAIEAHVRPGFEIAPVALTWGMAVFLAMRRHRWLGRRAFVVVPRTHLPDFIRGLEAGSLDRVIREYLRRTARGRRLEDVAQTSIPGLFDELGLRRGLLPAEPWVDAA